jgi:hypothetical protein
VQSRAEVSVDGLRATELHALGTSPKRSCLFAMLRISSLQYECRRNKDDLTRLSTLFLRPNPYMEARFTYSSFESSFDSFSDLSAC